jgi:hypothetical protein
MRSIPLLLLTCGSLLGQIDLTPTASIRKLDGAEFAEVLFRDGARQISYDPPTGWTYNGNSTRLDLRPPNNDGQASVTVSSLPTSAISKEDRNNQLRDAVRKFIPPGAELVQFAPEEMPLQIDGRDTVEENVTYTIGGQRYHLNVVFLDVDNTRLAFRLQGLESSFDEVKKVFRRSLFSWQWLPAQHPNIPSQ